ncbi:MAG TPA: TlpA disulfide reductase family protein [Janthinobacterium sp.]|nr:TlpA disulfide reductase family protein [Janthinobacterium sp.]
MSKKNLISYAVIALIFGGAGVYIAKQKNNPAPVVATAPASAPAASAVAASDPVQSLYDQQLKDLSGQTQALSQWKGKALIVNFWAPWCGPCVREMPELSALQKEVAGKNIQVLGLGIDSPENIAEFAKKVQIAYPVYVAGMGGTELSRLFGDKEGSLPYTVLIGVDGQIKKTYLGALKFDQLRADLASL